MTVQRSQASVERGQTAAYTVRVSTGNSGSASDVSVALAAQPTGQKPTFTSGCAEGNGAVTCAVNSVSARQPASLQAQIPVAADASSVTSVTLTVTASIVTSAKWTPPSAAVTVAITAAPATAARSSAGSSPAQASLWTTTTTTVPIGPLPDLNNISSSVIDPGNASRLFPLIHPSATPSPRPGVHAPAGKPNAHPVAESSAIGSEQPALTGQVAGLIALAVAILLTVTRLSLRRRFRWSKRDNG